MSGADEAASETLDYAWRRGGQRSLSLHEYVSFARERALSATLELRRGPIEIGRIDLDGGEVVHAELPGSEGDAALRHLGRLERVEVDVAAGRRDDRSRSVAAGRAILESAALDDEARGLLAAAFAIDVPATGAGAAPPPATAAADFDATFVAGMRAYARRDYRGALERFELCARLRPDDSKVRHNIDRLRRRLESR